MHIFYKFILIADGFFRVLTFTGNPLREENSAVQQFAVQIKKQADAGAGWFMPVNLKDAGSKLYGIHLLMRHPAPAYQPLMDTVIAGRFVARIPLIFPAVIFQPLS